MIDDPGDDLLDDAPQENEGADTEALVVCPYCGEANEIALDAGGGTAQEYVEDCQVCCRPWRVTVSYNDLGAAEVTAEPLEDD